MPRGNKYILENILLNIFKFYILKYIIKIEKNLRNTKINDPKYKQKHPA